MSRHAMSFKDFSGAARSEMSLNSTSLVPQTSAPAQQVSRHFEYQSYFDDTELERALLVQNSNEPIVQSTFQEEQIPGYAIGLHPSSQTCVAIQFKVGGQHTSSMPIILRPGQIVRPHGLPPGIKDGSFSGFAWGLPYGWLGGGLATLLVFSTPDADAAWPGNIEIPFHRQRMQITSIAGAPANARKNWPLRFPWPQALRGVSNIPQQGEAAISINPTRVLMSLRLQEMTAVGNMRIIAQESNDFDLDSAGAVIATPVRFKDFVWPTYTDPAIAGNLGAAFPLEWMPNEIVRLAADDGGIALVDLDGGVLTDAFVDVVRYGTIG